MQQPTETILVDPITVFPPPARRAIGRYANDSESLAYPLSAILLARYASTGPFPRIQDRQVVARGFSTADHTRSSYLDLIKGDMRVLDPQYPEFATAPSRCRAYPIPTWYFEKEQEVQMLSRNDGHVQVKDGSMIFKGLGNIVQFAQYMDKLIGQAGARGWFLPFPTLRDSTYYNLLNWFPNTHALQKRLDETVRDLIRVIGWCSHARGLIFKHEEFRNLQHRMSLVVDDYPYLPTYLRDFFRPSSPLTLADYAIGAIFTVTARTDEKIIYQLIDAGAPCFDIILDNNRLATSLPAQDYARILTFNDLPLYDGSRAARVFEGSYTPYLVYREWDRSFGERPDDLDPAQEQKPSSKPVRSESSLSP